MKSPEGKPPAPPRSPYRLPRSSTGCRADSRPFYHPSTDEPDPRILFVQHYNLLCDPRLGAWREAIREVVRPGDTVLDLGAGTGILSLFAAERARRVLAVDADPHLVRYIREIARRHGRADIIRVRCGDARRLPRIRPVDVVICEMLDTALLKEHQVQVLNRAVRRLLRPGGRVVPAGVTCSVEGISQSFDFYGYTLPLPHFATSEARPPEAWLTPPVEYLHLDFQTRNPIRVQVRRRLPVEGEGTLNALRLTSRVHLTASRAVEGSHWFNPPLVLPLDPVRVRRGQHLEVELRYRLGGGMRHLEYRASVGIGGDPSEGTGGGERVPKRLSLC